jgi:Protein of unknown function (DUF5674)
MIHLIRTRATLEQIEEMLKAHEFCIKIVVDVRRCILAGGGDAHSACEETLLADGSQQQDIWGGTWVPETGQLRYDSLINIRSAQSNPSMEVLNPLIRDRMVDITKHLLEGV